MTELEVIRKDVIRLAAVVVNLLKKYKPFQERARGLGYRALNTRQLSDLEHVCQELRTVYARLLAHERSALAQEMDMDDPDLGLEPTASPHLDEIERQEQPTLGQAMIEMWLILAGAIYGPLPDRYARDWPLENPIPYVCPYARPSCRYRCYCPGPHCSLDCCY